MKTTFTSALSFLIAMGFIFLCNSCTLIGFGVGSIVDKNRNPNDKKTDMQLDKLVKEQKIIVHRNDKTKLKGTYLGLTEMPEEEYKANYIRFRNQYLADSLFPVVGDTLRIFDTSSKTSAFGKLVAFTYNAVKLVKIDSGAPFTAYFDNNTEVYFKNTRFDATSYHDLPVITLLNLEGKDKRNYTIGMNDISYVSRNNWKQPEYIGLMSGFVIDVVLITIFAINFEIEADMGSIW